MMLSITITGTATTILVVWFVIRTTPALGLGIIHMLREFDEYRRSRRR
jgi:hypothetical protein